MILSGFLRSVSLGIFFLLATGCTTLTRGMGGCGMGDMGGGHGGHEENVLVGNKVLCPVDGMALTVTKDTPAAVHENRRYYFCTEEEKKAFLAEPGKYLSETPRPQEGSGHSSH